MTLHDLGSNHKSLLRFTKHPSMVNIASRYNITNGHINNIHHKSFYEINHGYKDGRHNLTLQPSYVQKAGTLFSVLKT